MNNVICSDNASEVHQTAKIKARYGHREWIGWTGRDGKRYAALKNFDSIKSALLATGTQGTFYLYGASDGLCFLINWRIGIIMLKNSKYGI